MMTTSAFDGNDDARWRMTPDQERRSTIIYRLVVWSTPLILTTPKISMTCDAGTTVSMMITTRMMTTADH
jgi:hypothetical protein